MSRISKLSPFLTYLAGLGALLSADILVTTYLGDDQIAQWGAVRSFIGISSVACLIGLDQVLIRSPESAFKIMRVLAIQIPLVSTILACVYQFIDPTVPAIWVMAVSLTIAGGLGLFQYYRTLSKRFEAQWAQQNWKILVCAYLVATIMGGWNFQIWPALAIIGTFALVTAAIPFWNVVIPNKPAKTLRWMYSIGVRSLITSLLLSMSIYAEQLLVGAQSDPHNAAYYFSHTTFFLLPVSVINGYLAFNVAPWLRENKDTYIRHRDVFRWRWLMALATYAIALNCIGYVGWLVLRGDAQLPSHVIQVSMLLTSMARTAYTFPAGFVSAFGTASTLDGWIIFQGLVFATAILVYWSLKNYAGVPVVEAVAIASSVNWLGRNAAGYYLCSRLEKTLA